MTGYEGPTREVEKPDSAPSLWNLTSLGEGEQWKLGPPQEVGARGRQAQGSQ